MDKGMEEERGAGGHGGGIRVETGACGEGGVGVEVEEVGVDEVGWR